MTELFTTLQKPWDGIEASATFFARGDRIEKQLVKTGQTENPSLHLAFALAATEVTGKFENALCKWHAKGATIKTFANFQVYIQVKFAKKTKNSKTLAQSVGSGIANAMNDKMDKVDEADAATIVITKVTNAMQTQQNKQFKQMMQLIKTSMQSNGTHNVPTLPPPPSNNGGGSDNRGEGHDSSRCDGKKRCPHFKWMVYNKPEKCFEMEANVAKCPAGWKSMTDT